jgi:hypothetical protein
MKVVKVSTNAGWKILLRMYMCDLPQRKNSIQVYPNTLYSDKSAIFPFNLAFLLT